MYVVVGVEHESGVDHVPRQTVGILLTEAVVARRVADKGQALNLRQEPEVERDSIPPGDLDRPVGLFFKRDENEILDGAEQGTHGRC